MGLGVKGGRESRGLPGLPAWACLLVLLWLLAGCERSPAAAAVEVANEGLLPHAPVSSLAFVPGSAREVYAATVGAQGLWVSHDAGQSWQAVTEAGLQQPIYGLLASRGEPGRLYAGAADGLWEKAPGDGAWQRVADVPLAPVYALLEDQAGAILAGGGAPRIYRLASGRPWQPLAPLPIGSGPMARTLAGSDQVPANGAVLALAAGPDGTLIAGSDGAGLFRSPDDGQTWQPAAPEIGPTSVAGILLAGPDRPPGRAGGVDSAVGLARTRRGLFRTLDGGSTWQPAGQVLPGRIDALAVDPARQSLLLGTSLGDLYQSRDDGETWQRLGRGLGRAGLFFTLHIGGKAGAWYAGTEYGLYSSSDAGLTWQPLSQGPGHPQANGLAAATGVLYLAAPDGVYRSTDGGQSWAASREGLPPVNVLSVAASPADATRLYAGLDGAGLYRSDDGGQHWRATGWARASVPALLLDPHDPQHLFIRVAFERVYESRDGGQSWAARWDGLGLQTQVIALALDPTRPGTLYAGGTESFFRSQDGAAHWQTTGIELAGQTVFTLVPGTRDGTLVAGTTGGVYRSWDRGDAWERWGKGLEGAAVTALALVPGRPELAFAGTQHGGLWLSQDAGRTWQPVEKSPADLGVRALLVTEDGRWVLAATDRGVYRMAVRQP